MSNFYQSICRKLLLCCVLIATVNICSASTIKHQLTGDDPNKSLILDILKMALKTSSPDESYRFEEYNQDVTEARMMEMVMEGSLTVMWAGTQQSYEKALLPIRIPVLKGLLGHRIFIMRDGDQHRFNQINSIEQLRRISLGQGRFWGDTAILQKNEMSVVTPVKYHSLFHMLEGGRFDLFPRAVHEPWSELASRPELNLSVENKLLLVYPFAMYFFVNKNDTQIANDIESGFRYAINSGEFDKLFFAHPLIADALAKSDLKSRQVFRLDNPYMSPETPVDDASLWLNIEQL